MTDAPATAAKVGPVRLRVAPSPTGDPHVGTAYMSLFNLAFVRQQGGQFVLRIEDTDRARYREDSEQQVFDTLHWLGLDWDEGPDKGGPFAPYRQSERLASYQPYVDKLLADGHAYHCWCSTERLAQMREEQQKAKLPTGYDRLCYGKTREERAALPGFSEQPVVRMLIPDDAPTSFRDLIRGEVNAPRPDDQVILKADGFPTYHLASVVDDHEMAITHVVRGEEWISSTPKHILLYRWLGLEPPAFAHMPLLRNTDKSKISKRKNPAARLTWFQERGYLPEALRNFLALMGYSLPDGREVFTFQEMVDTFDWERINTVGPVFDLDKLDWLNGHYIRELAVDDLAGRITDHLVRAGVLPAEPTDEQRALVLAATPLVNERMQVLSEAETMLGFLLVPEDEFAVDEDSAKAVLGEGARPALEAALGALEQLEGWDHGAIEAALRAALVEGLGLKPKHAFGPVRVAVTGRRVSPPLFESIELLGRERSLRRLRAALAL
ncbi:MAG TPA: glutamate--tRNA ligase [Motilibacteraceae bacterium]|nr:glutamate--tRNA ligase [Motilibacteraceae bacterium]